MSKSRMAGVAALFGLELGEVFHIRNAKCVINDDFKFTEEGLMRSSWPSDVWETAKAVDLKYLLNGTYSIIKLWKPNNGEVYYVPLTSVVSLSSKVVWIGDKYDYLRLSKGVVCKDKEEAEIMAKRMFAVAQEIRKCPLL